MRRISRAIESLDRFLSSEPYTLLSEVLSSIIPADEAEAEFQLALSWALLNLSEQAALIFALEASPGGRRRLEQARALQNEVLSRAHDDAPCPLCIAAAQAAMEAPPSGQPN